MASARNLYNKNTDLPYFSMEGGSKIFFTAGAQFLTVLFLPSSQQSNARYQCSCALETSFQVCKSSGLSLFKILIPSSFRMALARSIDFIRGSSR